MLHSLNLMVDELARQVKRHRDKLRHRREAHAAARAGARGGRLESVGTSSGAGLSAADRASAAGGRAAAGRPPWALRPPGGSYPWPMPSLLDRALNVGEAKKFKAYQKRVALINAFEPELEHDSDDELRERMDELRERAADGEDARRAAARGFALVREAGKRTMGMRHFDVQLIGGMVLHDGRIAEMKTGEGKTLTATLAVFLNSLAGRTARTPRTPDDEPRRKGVHVVTVNDYLARRDAEWMRPIYEALGVTVGALQDMQPTRRSGTPTPATSSTAPTPSSASTTCATTWPRTSPKRSSAATTSRSWTRSTTS